MAGKDRKRTPDTFSESVNQHEPTPRVSIVIPVFNEEGILRAAVVDLIARLAGFSHAYEIILAENGSRDATAEIAVELGKTYPQLRLISIPEPNYGRALRTGILEARGEFVICDEIDLCDVAFYGRALELLVSGEAALVIGSKTLPGSQDKRPLSRRAATQVINSLLRVATGFRGSDTHGLKAMHKASLEPVVRRCVVDKDLFASELVIRAERSGVPIREIPVVVIEKRPPPLRLTRRVPNVLRHLAILFWVIRVKK